MMQGKVNINLSTKDTTHLISILSEYIAYIEANGYNDDYPVVQTAKRLKDKITESMNS